MEVKDTHTVKTEYKLDKADLENFLFDSHSLELPHGATWEISCYNNRFNVTVTQTNSDEYDA